MTSVVFVIGIILLVVALALVYRVFSLVSVVKNTTDKPQIGLSNKVNAALLIVFMVVGFGLFFWYHGVAQDYMLPEAASEHGLQTDQLFGVTMAIVTAAFVITNILLFVFAFMYRYKEGRKSNFYPHNSKLEMIWTIVPAIVMAALVFMGLDTWSTIMSPAPENTPVVEIMGKQFNWQVRYPGKDLKLGKYHYTKIDATNSLGIDLSDPASMDDFSPKDIHLAKGQEVLLNIRARDVLHSVFMPHFRVKMDAVPGNPTFFHFKPTKTTQEMRDELSKLPEWQKIDPKTKEPRWKNFNYELACTEVCGSGHFAMRMIIIVDEPADYDKWYMNEEAWSKKNADYVSQILGQSKSETSSK